MKLTAEKLEDRSSSDVSSALLKRAEKMSDPRCRESALHFKQLEQIQETLDKLGHLIIVGPTQLEIKLLSELETIESLSNGSAAVLIKESLSAFEKHLLEYEDWIEQNNSTLTPYELRRYIKEGRLTHEDLYMLTRHFSKRPSSLIDPQSKFELVFGELCKRMNEPDNERLLSELFPDPHPLSEDAVEILDSLRELTKRIESLIEFPQLIERRCLLQARYLKFSLGPSLWHPESICAIADLNLVFRKNFRRLFNAERHFIIASCRTLIDAGIHTIDELEDGESLSVNEAGRFAYRSEGMLEENYHTNMQTLQRIAKIGRWMRSAIEILAEQESVPSAFKAAAIEDEPEHPVSPHRTGDLEPISIVSDGTQIAELERQLDERIDEIRRKLEATTRCGEIETIRLKYSALKLLSFEVEALLSPGKAVESTLRQQQYHITRRSIALIAELQESAAVFAEEGSLMRSKYYSIPSLAYYLEHNERAQGEVEIISQKTREAGDVETALDLLAIRSKLQKARAEDWRIIAGFFPTMSAKKLALYIPTK